MDGNGVSTRIRFAPKLRSEDGPDGRQRIDSIPRSRRRRQVDRSDRCPDRKLALCPRGDRAALSRMKANALGAIMELRTAAQGRMRSWAYRWEKDEAVDIVARVGTPG